MPHKILSSSRTSGVGGGQVVEKFRSCCCFLVSYFLSFVEEFHSCLSKPEKSVCHFGLSIGQFVTFLGFTIKVTIAHVAL